MVLGEHAARKIREHILAEHGQDARKAGKNQIDIGIAGTGDKHNFTSDSSDTTHRPKDKRSLDVCTTCTVWSR